MARIKQRRPHGLSHAERLASREDRQTILFLGGVLVGITLMGLLAFLGRWLS